MTDYKATPEQWAQVEAWMAIESEYSACVLELRARVEALEKDATEDSASTHFVFDAIIKRLEALEANSKPSPNSSQIGSFLVERVAAAIHPNRCADPNLYLHEARAAIREVAAWLREQKAVDLPDHTQWAAARAADVLEQETDRG